MIITLVTQDTRGGVQPYAALARALRAAGHEVRAVAPADLAWLFERASVPCLPLEAGPGVDATAIALAAQGDRAGGLRTATRALMDLVPGWAMAVRDFAAGSDLLAGGVGGSVLGRPVAAALGVAWVPAHLQPVGLRSADWPGVFLPGLPRMGGLGYGVGQSLTDLAIATMLAPAQRVAHRALGRARRRGPSVRGAVYGISPLVLPPPTNRSDVTLCGYWFDPADADELPAALDAFVTAEPGRPVISVGFGSMVSRTPAALRRMVCDAAAEVDARVVLIAGSGALGAADHESADVIEVAGVPHHLLFGRMAANVHHGGAGTTAQAFAAGVPSVIVPFGADQPFWAHRATALGVAPAGIAQATVTSARLAQALRMALSDEAMRERAATLGRGVRLDDGPRVAAEWFARLAR